jgi:hypothetical protein
MKERSTLQPFAPGDVFVGSTVLEGGDDSHAGRGRILQYDEHLRKKGVLWLSQTTHLVGGLRFDRQGRLWAFDSQAFVVLTVERDGTVRTRDFGARPFSNVTFCSDGTLYLAEHVAGNGIKMEIQARMGTRLKKMPGTDRLGDGHVWHFREDGTLLRELATEVHGGIGGFMGVTMSALSPDETTLVYCSETGSRLMRYDLESARQMPDLQCIPDGERDMYFAMDYAPDGRLYVSRGTRVDLVSPEGRTMCCYPLEGHGWATLKTAADGRHLYVGNFFTGRIVKLELGTGEPVAVADTGVPRSLAGIAQFDGARGAQAAARGVATRRAVASRATRGAKSRSAGPRGATLTQPSSRLSSQHRQVKRKPRKPEARSPGKRSQKSTGRAAVGRKNHPASKATTAGKSSAGRKRPVSRARRSR